MINREIFFAHVRRNPFGGRLTPQQVDGMNKILDYWEGYVYPNKDIRHLGYMLVTTYHETGHTMQPIKEGGGVTYLKSKKYYPFFGRGLVQLTWEDNYALMSKILSAMFGIPIDLVKNPDEALKWEYALPIMFEGMFRGVSARGDFTGKSLEDYFNSKVNDPIGARKIINGTDRAEEIAGIYNNFLAALKDAQRVEEEKEEEEKPTISSFREIVDLIKTALDKLVTLYEAKK